MLQVSETAESFPGSWKRRRESLQRLVRFTFQTFKCFKSFRIHTWQNSFRGFKSLESRLYSFWFANSKNSKFRLEMHLMLPSAYCKIEERTAALDESLR